MQQVQPNTPLIQLPIIESPWPKNLNSSVLHEILLSAENRGPYSLIVDDIVIFFVWRCCEAWHML